MLASSPGHFSTLMLEGKVTCYTLQGVGTHELGHYPDSR